MNLGHIYDKHKTNLGKSAAWAGHTLKKPHSSITMQALKRTPQSFRNREDQQIPGSTQRRKRGTEWWWAGQHKTLWNVTWSSVAYATLSDLETETERSSRGLTSHSTHHRSFRGQLSQTQWPNQQCQRKETSWLWRSGLNLTRTTLPCWNNTTLVSTHGVRVPMCQTQSVGPVRTQSSTEQFW